MRRRPLDDLYILRRAIEEIEGTAAVGQPQLASIRYVLLDSFAAAIKKSVR
jgi:hypothetical protein